MLVPGPRTDLDIAFTAHGVAVDKSRTRQQIEQRVGVSVNVKRQYFGANAFGPVLKTALTVSDRP
ncbi:hypothetical protein R75461_08030 [Paraburkholderia nemoris]|nr:hypothetical protein R75461_08030 [Paraburkholderia nemoris]